MFIKPDCDLLLYNSFWGSKKGRGLNGHVFEILDYYNLLKNYFKVKCYFPEYNESLIKQATERYTVDFDFNDFIFDYHKLIAPRNSLNVDGSYNFFLRNQMLGNKLAFSCGSPKLDPEHLRPKDVLYFEDHRVYNHANNSVNYAKKIDCSIMKVPDVFDDRVFAHVTKDCKAVVIEPLIEKYPNLLCYSDYLPESYHVTNKPVKFGMFNKFVYTPVARHFDCSPRLIAECDYFKIPVDYYNIDYKDIGLETRQQDIKTKSYLLKQDDPIIELLNKYMV